MHKESANLDLNLYLAICSTLIVQKMNTPTMHEWPNAKFIQLSTAIARETKVYISKNTLKRIFGKLKTEESYCPQKATLDALAGFIGYPDWDKFKANGRLRLNEELNDQGSDAQPVIVKSMPIGLPIKKSLIFTLLAIATIVLTALTVFFKNNPTDQKVVRLSCVNPDGKNRHSAVFKLQVAEGYTDTGAFTVDFNDKSKTAVKLNNDCVVHYYDTPGWYQTILSRNGVPIDTNIVRIESDGWFAYVSGQSEIYRKALINSFDGSISGMKGLTNKDIIRAGGDTIKPFFLHFANIKKTNIDGDNFELQTRVKMSDVAKHGECAQVHFSIYGDIDDDYIGITSPNCTAWANAEFSEQVRAGLWTDLRSLGKDLSNGGSVKLYVKNKKVSFYVNNKLIYTTKYSKKLGKISGVKILFSGIGEVYAFSLRDLNSGENF